MRSIVIEVARELKTKLQDFDRRNQAPPRCDLRRGTPLPRSFPCWVTMPARWRPADATWHYQRRRGQVGDASSSEPDDPAGTGAAGLQRLGRRNARRALAGFPSDGDNLDRRSSVVVEWAEFLSTREARMPKPDACRKIRHSKSTSSAFTAAGRLTLLARAPADGIRRPSSLLVARQAQEEYAREPTAFPSNVAHGDTREVLATLYNERICEAAAALRALRAVPSTRDRPSLPSLETTASHDGCWLRCPSPPASTSRQPKRARAWRARRSPVAAPTGLSGPGSRPSSPLRQHRRSIAEHS